MKRIYWFVLLAVLSIVAGYFLYDGYVRYLAFNAAIIEDAKQAAAVAQQRERINATLAAEGIDPLQIARGFWYTYKDQGGGESIDYFDLSKWAFRTDLTEADIQMLAALVKSAERTDRDAMKVVSEKDLPIELQFHNHLYNDKTPGEFRDTEAALVKMYRDGTATAEQLWGLSYLYELRGDYAARDRVNEASCKKYKARCEDKVQINISGRVMDTDGRPIQGANVSVLGRDDVSVKTDTAGKFSMQLRVKAMEKVRLSAVKRNFSSGVASVIVVSGDRASYSVGDVILGSPITIITIDTEKHTVTDPGSAANPDGSFTLRADLRSEEIPAGAIVRAKGSPYKGAVDVYIYEFTRETVPQNLITLDTFDQVIGYAGNLMKSYGMPYIQFFSQSGEELDVYKSKPMLLTYKVPGMQAMLDNSDDLPSGPVTPADLRELVSASKGDPDFPITAEFLVRNTVYSYPPFWVLDRISGVWENIGIRVLDVEGTIQTPFYTINDVRSSI